MPCRTDGILSSAPPCFPPWLALRSGHNQPLGDDEGRIAMVSSKDTRTGPRHVKWLQDIEVKKIAD